MSDNDRKQDSLSGSSDSGNMDQNQQGSRQDISSQNDGSDNPQQGSAWDNYQTRSLSSNPPDETEGGLQSSRTQGSERNQDQDQK